MIDLEHEAEQLLSLLERTEELRVAVPSTCTNEALGSGPVLIGVTDRRILLVSRTSTVELDLDLIASERIAGAKGRAGAVQPAPLSGGLSGVGCATSP
jgi:hypothetical protein